MLPTYIFFSICFGLALTQISAHVSPSAALKERLARHAHEKKEQPAILRSKTAESYRAYRAAQHNAEVLKLAKEMQFLSHLQNPEKQAQNPLEQFREYMAKNELQHTDSKSVSKLNDKFTVLDTEATTRKAGEAISSSILGDLLSSAVESGKAIKAQVTRKADAAVSSRILGEERNTTVKTGCHPTDV